jgi:hypothetical protein
MQKRIATLLAAAMLLTVAGCSKPAATDPVPVDSASPTSTTSASSGTAAAPQTTPAPTTKPADIRLFPAHKLVDGVTRWGYVDRSGAFVVAPQFDVAEAFGPDGLAVIYQNNKAGLVNQNGQIVLEPKADWVHSPTDGVRIAYVGELRRVIDPSGAVLFDSHVLAGPFGDGLAPMARNGLYGYVDKTGAVAIEPQYAEAVPFADGMAIVRVKDGPYAIIDTTGKRLLELNQANVIHLAEGLVAFRETFESKWGYASVTGDVAIAPQFAGVRPFAGGLAVVNAADSEAQPRWGVIDRQGAFVIPPQYSDIEDLGGGLFAVGEPREYATPSHFVRHAIFTAEGRQLTAFMYYTVEPTEYGLCVTDETATYFLDRAGRRVENLPAVKGIGSIRFVGDLIALNIDGDLRYMTRDGKTVWQADNTWPLSGGARVLRQKFQPDHYLSIQYPELTGLPDAAVQAAINDRLKALFLPDSLTAGRGPGDHKESISFGFRVQQVGNVLVVEQTGHFYPIGAAHGSPSKEYYHFDLATGAEYQLADLFKQQSPFAAVLEAAVARQLAADPRGLNDPTPAVRQDHPFAAGTADLTIYWHVYEIGPYAAGFPTFGVPYADLQDLIDTEGAFWKALGVK